MTYELTAVRGPCLGRCMYGRCAVYGGCGPRHRRCGPILLRGARWTGLADARRAVACFARARPPRAGRCVSCSLVSRAHPPPPRAIRRAPGRAAAPHVLRIRIISL